MAKSGLPLPVLSRFAFVFLHLILSIGPGTAQPPNDNCSTPAVISIPNNGFGVGIFNSSIHDITMATVQAGETFAPAILLSGQNIKSVWYKFTIPTTRQIKVTLAQVGGTIAAGDVGFTVYKFNSCLPVNSDISAKLTPIALFGDTYHPCVEQGTYYIQVSAKASAGGSVYITIETGFPAASYDKPSQAFNFGILAELVRTTSYQVGCLSTEDANEVCSSLPNYTQYTKTSWHIFKTPAYFDYVALMVAKQNNTIETIGFRIYEGDVTVNPYSSLPVTVPCGSIQLDSSSFSRRIFKCNNLLPNKTYSIQLFFKYNFSGNIKVALAMAGTNPTMAPLPVLANIPSPTNALGTLPANGLVTAYDFFGCNSRHSVNACGPAITVGGVKYLPNNITYNLSSFFTFTLAATSNIGIGLSTSNCGTPKLVRLYQQGVSSNCNTLDTLNIISRFADENGTIRCLQPGNYTLQVMGSDSVVNPVNWNYTTFNDGDSAAPLCFHSDLGSWFELGIQVQKAKSINRFSINVPGAYDTINAINGIMQPLVHNVVYTSKADTFGCLNTVRPWDTACIPGFNKVMYRELLVTDSAVLSIFSFNNQNDSLYDKVYKGDAGALAVAQNVFSFPQKILNLVPWTTCNYVYNCDGAKVCVIPGTYTYVTFGSDANVSHVAQPSFRLNSVVTQFASPQNAENMGDILSQMQAGGGSLQSATDYFSCKDNAVPIDGFTPCHIANVPATKAIYRQFYLSAPTLLTITGYHFDEANCSYGYGGLMTLFSGKASNGLSTLTVMPAPWRCFKSVNASSCNILPAGWYTIVSYGSGPSYSNPMQNTHQEFGYGSYVASSSRITISIAIGCPAPKYNRPHRAAIDSTTNQPFLVEWGPNGLHTPAYPKTDRTYNLYPEYFNCTNDTPFSTHPIPACGISMTKIAYWVFRTTQESYVQINTKGYWGAVYMGNARTDSSAFSINTNVQPCLQLPGKIQICKLQPGTYTLVVFGDSSRYCQSVQPAIYIDRVGISRFDHAANAYDFGIVPPDSVWHKGKTGDVNPLDSSRAASNDFIYCTTGAQINDPSDPACSADYLPNIYNAGVNINMFPPVSSEVENIPRRNLWYTFVTDVGGNIRIRVTNKTPGKNLPYRFAVYKSDVNGLLPFSQVLSSGSVDSTIAQGLSLVATQQSGNHCYDVSSQISFYRQPCNAVAERYYILVENINGYPVDTAGMKPNSQLEVSILVDSINSTPALFDHYSTAGIIGTNLGPGSYAGQADNFSCATQVTADPLHTPYPFNPGCAYKTLWYKFSTNITGKVRYRVRINGKYAFGSGPDQAMLLRQLVPGDSSANGLAYIAYSSIIYENQGTTFWCQTCISPGTYYLFLPGCNRSNETVVPEIMILEEKGDFCSAPVDVTLNGAGIAAASVTVDCHTIGNDYGEFNSTLTCPSGAVKTNYKTSWIKINITGNDTLDVTTYLTENTNALPADIKYRIMQGNCNAMQEQSCVQDVLTQDTYKCLPPGSYYIQMFVPVFKNGSRVLGDVILNISSVKHVDTCAPMKGCLSSAVFMPLYDCNMDDTVRFINVSTYGTDIEYLWNFGYNNQTSTAVSPEFVYPALSTDQVYTVKLKVTNNGCNAGAQNVDSASVQLLVKGRPVFDLGKDTVLCNRGSSLVLNAATWPGSTYQWSTGQTTPSITISDTSGSSFNVSVIASYNGCTKKDSISVAINPIERIKQDKFLCGNDSVFLNSVRGFGEAYLWIGPVNAWYHVDSGNIYASNPGLYINELNWKGCLIIDSFNVNKAREPFAKTDTIICFPFHSFFLDATIPGALTYSWQNGSSNPSLMVTSPGIYSVNIWNGTCMKKDSIRVLVTQAAIVDDIHAMICPGQDYLLPWGAVVKIPGIYRDTIRFANGCDSLLRIVALSNQPFINNTDAAICTGNSYVLPWGQTAMIAGSYFDTVRTVRGCDSLIRSVKLTVNPSPVVSVSKSNDVNCKLGTALLSASGGDHYTWSPAASLNNAAIRNPVASPTSTTTYVVLAISNQNCFSKDSIQVIVNPGPGPGFELPDAFTPDGDGLNDCFGVRSWGAVSDLKLTIFNRWGELIFQTSDPSKCWDGNFRGRELSTAVFVYQVSANTICGKVYRKGTVTLIR